MALAPYVMSCSNPEVVAVVLRFQAGATGGAEPDFQVPAGSVIDVTRDGSAGVYTVTFNEKYPVFLGMVGSVHEATPAHDLIVKCDVADYDNAAGTLILTVVGVDGGTAAEDVIEDDWVFLVCYFGRRTALSATGAIA
jgi:hypothetical protein